MASKFVAPKQVFDRAALLSTYRQLLRATFIAFKGKITKKYALALRMHL